MNKEGQSNGDNATTYILNLSGKINENAQLSYIPDDKINTLYIDFEKVTFINSSGIGLWLRFVERLHLQSNIKNFIYMNCPSIIIKQINSIQDFVPPGGKVESFMLPVLCDKCDKQFKIPTKADSFNIATAEDLSGLTIKTDCDEYPACKSFFELDVMPGSFFAFLKRQSKT